MELLRSWPLRSGAANTFQSSASSFVFISSAVKAYEEKSYAVFSFQFSLSFKVQNLFIAYSLLSSFPIVERCLDAPLSHTARITLSHESTARTFKLKSNKCALKLERVFMCGYTVNGDAWTHTYRRADLHMQAMAATSNEQQRGKKKHQTPN